MTPKKRRERERLKEQAELRAPVAEQLLIDELPGLPGARILCTSLGRGHFAQAAAAHDPAARVVCHYFDVYLAEASRVGCAHQSSTDQPPGVTQTNGGHRPPCIILCSADFPAEDFDLVAIPVDKTGDAELTRDLLQSGHERLAIGGRLVAATSNVDDQWLHEEMRKLFPKVTRRVLEQGVVYLATKTAPLKKLKNFECEFAYRDEGRLIKAVSRPGVFSHRSVDAGARALINTMVVGEGDRVLDVGCGSGVVALAAACRAPGVQVMAVDSHARAVECTRKGASLNGLTNVSVLLNAEGDSGESGTFDVVTGNPPYYSDHRIAEIFVQAARRALKPGGCVLMVTKSPAWFQERMGELFDGVEVHSHKLYSVIEARQRE